MLEPHVDVAREPEHLPHRLLEQRARRGRAHALQRRVHVKPERGRAEPDRHNGGCDEHARPVFRDPGRERRPRQHPDRSARAVLRQERRNEDERQHAARHHAVADHQPELLQAREIDEHEPVERGGRGQHAEEHAGRWPAQRRDRFRHAEPVRQREPMRDVDEDHPVDPQAEEHGRGPGRRRRERRPSQPHQAERHDERHQRWQRAADEEPHAPEDEVEERQNQRQRSDAVQDGFPPDNGLGFDRDAVPARERDLHGRRRLIVVGAGSAPLRGGDRVQPLHQLVREPGIERGPAWLGDDEPAPAIGADVSPFGDAGGNPRALSPELLTEQAEQIERILAHHRRHRGRRHRQQFARRGQRAGHAFRLEAGERRVE